MRTPTAFERERAEGEGAFFGRSITSEKKVRRPVKRERTRQSHPGYFFCKNLKYCKKYLGNFNEYYNC